MTDEMFPLISLIIFYYIGLTSDEPIKCLHPLSCIQFFFPTFFEIILFRRKKNLALSEKATIRFAIY